MNLNDTSTKVLLICVVVLTGLLVTGAVIWGGGSTAPATTVDSSKVDTTGAPFIGEAGAPLTIVEWFDYQCPACKQFEMNALSQIATDYVDTGKVKMVFKDMAFLGEDSLTAAAYGRAIWKLYPHKYLAWRTAMFAAQDAEGDQGFGDAASIDKLNAGIAGLDVVKIAADVKANGNAYKTLVLKDKTEAQSIGIQSTPSLMIGTNLIQGSYAYATYQAALDALLASADTTQE